MTLGFKFFPLKDLFYSVFPTVGTYGSYANGIAPELFPNKWVAIAIGVVASIALAVIFRTDNIKTYKKSLAEILATGYFMNFTGRLGRLLKSKSPIEFSFPDKSVKTFTANKISVEIGLPKNLSSLNKYAESVEQNADIIYLREESSSEPFWLRAKIENEKLIIYEFPRTLFSLSKYLKSEFSDKKSADKNSKIIYSYFHNKIEQLRIEHSSEISNDKLNFISV